MLGHLKVVMMDIFCHCKVAGCIFWLLSLKQNLHNNNNNNNINYSLKMKRKGPEEVERPKSFCFSDELDVKHNGL